MPTIRVGHFVFRTSTQDDARGYGRLRLSCSIANRHFVCAVEHVHSRRPRMRMKKCLARFTRMNPVEIDAEIKPLTPQSLDDGRVVVYKETTPFGFLL